MNEISQFPNEAERDRRKAAKGRPVVASTNEITQERVNETIERYSKPDASTPCMSGNEADAFSLFLLNQSPLIEDRVERETLKAYSRDDFLRVLTNVRDGKTEIGGYALAVAKMYRSTLPK
jgi:hypothetical protein